jgi:N-acetylglucosaminyldiphosphoundecaprenol N-acetyl-beta-D-mannosaminyltransferase
MGKSEHRSMLFDLPVDVFETLDAHVAAIKQELQKGGQGLFVTFINPASFHLAQRYPGYLRTLHAMDIVLPDGIGVVWALRMFSKMKAARISFDASSLFHPVFSQLDGLESRVLLMGSRPGVADLAAEQMLATYPRLEIVGILDGFQREETYVAEVQQARPDFILCGMGAPYQERVLIAIKESGYSGVAYSCGGFLDQYIQKEFYYPQWINKWELRWLYRLWKEPRRLARRYFGHYQTFVRLVLANAIGVHSAVASPRRSKFDGNRTR